jgi:hypothetical protein
MLIFRNRLECVPLLEGRRYVLNHYHKALAEEKLSDNLVAQIDAPGPRV